MADAPPLEETARAGGSRFAAGVLLAVVVLIVAAGVAGTLVTVFNPFSDWYMHLMMYGSILGFLLLYLRAHGKARPIERYATMIPAVLLSGFFSAILLDLVPEQKVFYAGGVVWREKTSLLYLPVALLLAGGLSLLVHCTLLRGGRPKT